MENKVIIFNSTGQRLPDSKKNIMKNCEKAVNDTVRLKDFFLELNIVSDTEIRELNLEKRKKDRATDVLSFPLYNPDLKIPVQNLGQIVISYDTMKKQAKEIGHSLKEEFYRLLVHGILHLLGYDHEVSPEEEKKMQKKEDRILRLIFQG